MEKGQLLPSDILGREFKIKGSSVILSIETFTPNKCVICDEFIDFYKNDFFFKFFIAMIHQLNRFIRAKRFNCCLSPTCERKSLRPATKKKQRRNKFI